MILRLGEAVEQKNEEKTGQIIKQTHLLKVHQVKK